MISLIGPAVTFAALTLSPPATLPNPNRLQLVDCKVMDIYGVPLNPTQEDIAKLGFRYKVGMEDGSEGGSYRTFDIVAKDGVVVTAVFSLIDDRILFVRTASPKAVDPKGIRVGDSLEAVRKAWPDGGLQLPVPGEEGITEPRYLTTTNIALLLGKTAGRGNALSVKAIQFVDFIPFKALPNFKGC
jgi:hypothetical protein